MTDNEKAATFIGWKPEQPCTSRTHRIGFRISCEFCAFNRHASESELRTDGAGHAHFLPPPDMRDPRNYMAALEDAQPKDERREGMLASLSRTIWNHDPREIVDYLAALYDAEHPEEKE